MNGPEIGSNREDMPTPEEQLAALEQKIAAIKAELKKAPAEEFKQLQDNLATAEEARDVIKRQIVTVEVDTN